MLFNIAIASIWHRKFVVALTIISIAISVVVVLAVEHIRVQAKQSFTSTLSDTDLIVGARGGQINLLLYSVFRIGNAANNISWQSYETIAQQKGVKWTIPISLGDSHKGYRVLATDSNYFTHYRYSEKRPLMFSVGNPFNGVYEVVLGSEVARKLHYRLGDKIILSHGVSEVSFTQHDDKPFTVTGILKPTGTPVDQTLHINLAGMEAIHIDWKNGAPLSSLKIDAETALKQDLTPKTITAFLVGLDNKIMTFRLQRQINEFRGEPLMAILPGVALSELWQIMGMIEKLLLLIAGLVVLAALLGMTTMTLSTLKQRQKEIMLLRTIGAPTYFIVGLIQLEAILIAATGIIVGIAVLWLSLLASQLWISSTVGIHLNTNPLTLNTLAYCISILLITVILAAIPSAIAYRQAHLEIGS